MIPNSEGTEGNPADIVEVRADLIVRAIEKEQSVEMKEGMKERIDWWLEEGGDEYVLHFSGHSPTH